MYNDIKGFPIEVVHMMVLNQRKQGNIANVKVFQYKANMNYSGGGFDWEKTDEGYDFWNKIIFEKNFNLFFNKYPKKENKENMRYNTRA